ncbi:MAG: C45 family autoproteolytic acyltransferase/hydrolase [Bacillota bacterium]|jgi:hypothetical protein|nr:C45 family autoproteolytic acyltransferase/hydrolase [Bacillota bacterium]
MRGYQIQRFRGNACEIGLYIGKQVKGRFKSIIDHFLKAMERAYGLDFNRLGKEALPWLSKLPEEYQLEVESLAYGSAVKLEKIAQWLYCDRLIFSGCSSFIVFVDGVAWVGRNFDHTGSCLWRNINIIEKEGRIPAVIFGQEGALFSHTGFNYRKLWLHYNHLPAWDMPDSDEKTIPPFVFIRMALENCSNISEVEKLLQTTVRDGGMNLFVVDGKNNTHAVYECTCKGYIKRQSSKPYIAGSNHYTATTMPKGFKNGDKSSVSRMKRMEDLLATMRMEDPYRDFTRILSHPEVEQNLGVSGTVYSNLACPSKSLYYYACNGFPAASKSAFEEVIFP